MSGTVNYKCPRCRAGLGFDPTSGKFVCHYCDGIFSKEEMEILIQKEDAKQEDLQSPGAENTKMLANMQLFSCPSCGAEIMTDAYTTAGRCVYCGNNAVIGSRLQGAYAPDYMIPFELSKEEAIQTYKKELKAFPYAPNIFRKNATLEKITGVYIPAWLYSGMAQVDMLGEGKINYSTSGYKCTEHVTEYYEVMRQGDLNFEKVPIDASQKMDDHLMQAIEPYPYHEIRPFDMSFLSGFLADRFDEDANRRMDLAKKRIYYAVDSITRADCKEYSSLSYKKFDVEIKNMEYSYAYLPVWLLNVRFNNKLYYYAINGKTGKFAGSFPISKAKAFKHVLFKTARVFIIVSIIIFIMGFIMSFS